MWSAGADVVIHDPKAGDNVRAVYPHLQVRDSLAMAVDAAELVVVGTEWRDYAQADPALLATLVDNKLVIDGRNVLPHRDWQAAGWKVIALGRNLDNSRVALEA